MWVQKKDGPTQDGAEEGFKRKIGLKYILIFCTHTPQMRFDIGRYPPPPAAVVNISSPYCVLTRRNFRGPVVDRFGHGILDGLIL